MSRHANRPRLSPCAFTVPELMAVVAIASIVLALLLPAMSKSRNVGRQARSLSGMHQVMVGYTTYRIDHSGHLLWGYTPSMLYGKPVTIVGTDQRTYGLPIADRYPWRLAPYVGNIWEILHSHTKTPPIPQAADSPSDAMMKAYTLSINPTYGINSAYVGGSTGVWEGFVNTGTEHVPNVGKHVVFRAFEVRRPSQLIVFADSQARNLPSSDPTTGMHFVSPPYARGQRWKAEGDICQTMMPGTLMGVPDGRYTARAVTGFYDGHSAAMHPRELMDMRLWANRAESETYDFWQP